MFTVAIVLAVLGVALVVWAFVVDLTLGAWPLAFGTLLIVAAIALSLVAAVRADNAALEEFMRQCQQDHKEYECIAMWRAGDSHTQVVPVVVPIR